MGVDGSNIHEFVAVPQEFNGLRDALSTSEYSIIQQSSIQR